MVEPVTPPEIRVALYHRFARLLPFVFSPAARRFWKGVGLLLLAVYFAFALLILALRYAILPNIESYRGDIERAVGSALGLPVAIGGVRAGWQGLHPDLFLEGVRIHDADGRPALAFDRVEVVLAWTSLLHRELRLRLLAIDDPVLHVRRAADGRLFIAGIPAGGATSGPDPSDWLLAQERIRIHNATLVWEDESRAAPPLRLSEVHFGLDNRGNRHRFGFTAVPPAVLASRIDVRGDLSGNDLETLSRWRGTVFAEMDYTDLAGWHPWIDYPVALPRGQGGLRAWLTVADGRLQGLTADVALAGVRLRLADDLPVLDLQDFSGRIGARRLAGGYAVHGRDLVLTTRDGIALAPGDFRAEWQASEAGLQRGNGSVTTLDLAALARLSGFLPLDAGTRALLADFAPRGRIRDLKVSWRGNREALSAYTVKGHFAGLGLTAWRYVPGFANLSGQVEASEAGGLLTLDAHDAALDLPSVFPEPRLALDRLEATVGWTRRDGATEVQLREARFASRDAAGEARGDYVLDGDGPGRIDLQATLSRADGRAVWRYMPHAVNADARQWLRRGIVAGRASDARLTLKGDLARFPFLDGSGTFLVTTRAHDVTLDYAPGWPRIEGIEARLRFEGAGMRVEAERGRILGTRLSRTVAEIPDFDAAEEMLHVAGRVEGPTAEFFRFIDRSPVAAAIDEATEDMRATGGGRLDLELTVPLRRTDATRVRGQYQFLDNEIVFAPFLPPFSRVAGRLDFTEQEISVREVTGQFLGGPARVSAQTRDGRVVVDAQGQAQVREARRLLDMPLLDHVSGTVPWRSELQVRRKDVDLTVESDLLGLASSLPEPFNKGAREALPLRFARQALAAGGDGAAGDLWSVSLGNVASASLERRQRAGVWRIERAALGVGATMALPERGYAATVVMPRIDVDFWRRALAGGGPAGAPELPPMRVAVRTPRLDLFGRSLHEVDLFATTAREAWKARLNASEAAGELEWDGFGRGALRARLRRLVLDEPAGGEPAPGVGDALDELPAVDLVAESFAIGERALGRLEIQARNEAQNWRVSRLSLRNPDGSLEGSGVWRMTPPRRTSLDFRLDTEDAGQLLARLGHPGTMRRGTASLSGALSWNGSPLAIDYPSLSGEMRLTASKGQFAKLDPGAGKLLGLLSLQSLPRRITLDFRDVFSEGFAFDTVAGQIRIARGVMRTDALQIDGASARIVIQGEADLRQETQHLRVNIQPELGGTAAVGIGLVNPVAGVATLLAHKILQNPLNRLFSFDYEVTGRWDDPKVEKLSARAPAADAEGDADGRSPDRP